MSETVWIVAWQLRNGLWQEQVTNNHVDALMMERLARERGLQCVVSSLTVPHR